MLLPLDDRVPTADEETLGHGSDVVDEGDAVEACLPRGDFGMVRASRDEQEHHAGSRRVDRRAVTPAQQIARCHTNIYCRQTKRVVHVAVSAIVTQFRSSNTRRCDRQVPCVRASTKRSECHARRPRTSLFAVVDRRRAVSCPLPHSLAYRALGTRQ